MKRITKITLKMIPDYDCDLSYLGTFSNEKGEYAIKHEGDRNTFPYFNADNVENMKDAKQNYDRMMEHENGNIMCYGIKATAEIQTSDKGNYWLCNTISSAGLWGLESDGSKEDFQEVYDEQLEELRETLLELGFTAQEVTSAPIEKKED